MLRCEIIRTGSHEKVAEAAVLSIGPCFRDRVALLARASGMEVGSYVASLVRRFEDEASEREFAALTRITTGSDMPILDGLRWIVEFMIDGTTTTGEARSATRGGPRNPRAERCAHAA